MQSFDEYGNTLYDEQDITAMLPSGLEQSKVFLINNVIVTYSYANKTITQSFLNTIVKFED
ncbi:MAG: hypothetical protein M3Q97_05705 [Bacteroidota bacterium]|nr:hypothetical protein [Bacteroidota bacterium]